MIIPQSEDMSPIVMSLDGDTYEITPHLWQRNQQQSQILLRYFAIPLQENEQTLWLGIDSLNNISACETFAFLYGKIVEPVLLNNQLLKQLLQNLSPQQNNMFVEEQPINQYVTEHRIEVNEKSDEPVIQLLDHIFENALKQNVSDIHIEPQMNCLQIRFRIDGILQCQSPLPLSLSKRILSRLKLLAKLDISETRLPQDGRFHFKTTFSDILDFRLSTLPTNMGEKAVLRLQQNKPVQLSFAELGMTENQQKSFKQALSQPQGLILVTGPTGSGKSISLYTALQWLNDKHKHIMTAEDPIEIELNGIIQCQINPQIGLDFSRLLRTFLRQDPDIIMLGEIRDNESAIMALRAAQTGHLVLSTLHTNDAPSAVSRLLQLGVKQHEIDNSLLLVIAQRLVRKKCPHTENENCTCHQKYQGRIGVYQFLQPHLIDNHICYQTDYAHLRESAMEKVRSEITDLAEVDRVIGQSNE